VQTLTRRGVGDAAAGLGLHFLHMSEGPFSHDAGQYHINLAIFQNIPQLIFSVQHVLRPHVDSLSDHKILYK